MFPSPAVYENFPSEAYAEVNDDGSCKWFAGVLGGGAKEDGDC